MTRFGSDNRKRGRAGQVDRARRLKLYPLCADCEKEGIVRATDIIDHKTPLAFGGEDTDENCQGLCAWHDAIKTAAENTSEGGGATHPLWLQKPLSPAVVICGPPCGGKSYLAGKMRRPNDVLVDLDEIAAGLEPGWDRIWTAEILNKSLRIRNAMLGEAARRPLPNGGRLILIVSAPSLAERQWWIERLGASLMLCDPGKETALERAKRRDGRIEPVLTWYRRGAEPWTPKRPARRRLAVDEEGIPIEQS